MSRTVTQVLRDNFQHDQKWLGSVKTRVKTVHSLVKLEALNEIDNGMFKS